MSKRGVNRNVAVISAHAMLGKKPNEEEMELLMDFLVEHVDPHLDLDALERYEKNWRRTANLIFFKVTGFAEDPSGNNQNIARTYLDMNLVKTEPVAPKSLIRPDVELRRTTPCKVLKTEYNVEPIEVTADLGRYIFGTPHFAELMQEHHKSVVAELKANNSYTYARIMPAPIHQLSLWCSNELLNPSDKLEMVRYLTDLVEVKHLNLVSKLPGGVNEEDLIEALHSCPVVYVGQSIVPGVIVSSMEPPMAFCATPFDAMVPYKLIGVSGNNTEGGFPEITECSVSVKLCDKCAVCDAPPIAMCGGCQLLKYCSVECQTKHWDQHHEQVCSQ